MSENISLLGDNELTYTDQEFVDRLLFKKNEIDEMFTEQSGELDSISRQIE